MKHPSGLVTRGRALHRFFVRKYRARDVAPDGLTVLPGRQPYFNGLVGRNLVVQEGNKYILDCMVGNEPTVRFLSNDNVFLGVSDNADSPLRTDVGLGGDNKKYIYSYEPVVEEGDSGEWYIRSVSHFTPGDASFLWARASLCVYDNGGIAPTDDTVAGCINLGIALLDFDLVGTKPAAELWALTSKFSVW